MSIAQDSSRLGGTVTTFSQINFSSSKQQFSFGKQGRFPPKPKIIIDQYYDLPSSLKKRDFNFGVGARFKTPDLSLIKRGKFNTHISDSPSPGQYEIKSEFEIGKPGDIRPLSKRGLYSFGLGRDHFQKVYYPQKKSGLNDQNLPGPGQYDPVREFGQGGKKCKIHERMKVIDGKCQS